LLDLESNAGATNTGGRHGDEPPQLIVMQIV